MKIPFAKVELNKALDLTSTWRWELYPGNCTIGLLPTEMLTLVG